MEQERSREDHWFAENERLLLENARKAREARERERAAHEAAAEREKLKALHFMRCPKCGHEMREEDLMGVLIDRCTFCEGVYFDAGELDRLAMSKAEERKGFLQRLIGG